MIAAFLSLILVVALADLDDAGQLSETESRYLLHWTGWSSELIDEAIEVMTCESRRFPNRIGDHGDSIGLFQIQWTPSTWTGWKYAKGMEPFRGSAIDNIVANSQAALVIYQNYGGWREWSCKPNEPKRSTKNGTDR